MGRHAKKIVDWSERVPRKADGFVREQESTANEKKLKGWGLPRDLNNGGDRMP